MSRHVHSETVLEQLLEFAPDAVIGVSESGEIILANAQVEQVFGYVPSDLIGEQIEKLIPRRYRGDHIGHRARYFENPRMRPMGAGLELHALHHDGHEFPAEISLSSIETDEGVIATVAVRDVTDRRQAQRQFEQLLEFAPDAIVGIDKSGLIVLANAQMEEVFGYDRSELLGQSVEMLVPERFRQKHALHRLAYFHDKQTRPMGAGLALAALRADGTEFPAEISLSSIETPRGTIATAAVRDITDRVNAESVRRKLEAELQLNRSRRLESVGQLAGGVAHDFNNLLTVIINYAQHVASQLEDRPDLRADIAQIEASGKRAADLTRQLLIFSRRDVVTPRSINLNDILGDLEKLLRRAIGERVRFETSFQDDLWNVVADPGQIEQVVMNLAVNASQAMPEGGVFEIATANVELDSEFERVNPDAPPPGRYVRLTIADSGIGMSREIAERAFEPFFSTKKELGGTGLGLATVYGIVKHAGGSIILYSEPGSGTVFKIHLPATDQPAEVVPRGGEQHPRGSGERILVVEDEPAVLAMVKRILESRGYIVSEFASGRDALPVIEDVKERIDLLLTDVVMPEMQGQELAAAARAARPDLKVLFMSGYSEVIVAQQEVKGEIEHLIQKPFTSSELLSRVRRELGARTGD